MKSEEKVSKFKMTLGEVLTEINKDVSLLKTTYRYSPGSPLAKVFYYAFCPSARWALPDTDPPYRPSNLEAGMTPTDLLVAITRGRFEYFDAKMKIANYHREKIFIQLLESIDSVEAKILLAIKDQKLHKLYPNITLRVLAESGYAPKEIVDTLEVTKQEDTKSEEVPETPKKPRTTKTTTRKASTKSPKSGTTKTPTKTKTTKPRKSTAKKS